MKTKHRIAIILLLLIGLNVVLLCKYTTVVKEEQHLDQNEGHRENDMGFDETIQFEVNFSNYLLDVVINASVFLHTKYPLTFMHWRHYNPGVQYYNGKLYYFGRLSRLAIERMDGKQYWIKTNKFFAAIIKYDELSKTFLLQNSTFVDPFEKVRQHIDKPRSMDPDLASFGDCEMKTDFTDGGHGYQDPRLFVWNEKLHLLFNARTQVYDGSICEPEILRSQYLSEIQTDSDTFVLQPPVRLQVAGRHRVEKNWTPIVSGANLYFSYELFPEHIVLECGLVVNGDWQCSERYRTDSTKVFEEVRKRSRYKEMTAGSEKSHGDFKPHGGSILVPLNRKGQSIPEKYVGVFHYSHRNSLAESNYFNCVYYTEGIAPFKILKVDSDHLALHYDPGEDIKRLMEQAPRFYRNNYPSGKVTFASDATIVPYELLEGLVNNGRNRDFLLLSHGVADAIARIRIFAL